MASLLIVASVTMRRAMRYLAGYIVCILAITLSGPAIAAEPEVSARDLPRTPFLSPEAAAASFQIRPGYKLELVAAEPLVADPVAMCFDEDGRLYVVDMCDYSERRDEKLGKIRLLEDTNGDGKFDQSSIFAEGLPWPTAVFYYDGGLFVGVTPDVIRLKDTNKDKKADERKVVFSGFGAGAPRLNVQGLMNSFEWGLDNRIYLATGTMGGKITCAQDTNRPATELRGKDLSFDPKDLTEIRAETGGGQHGMSFADDGRRFVCHNSQHIRLVMYEDRYANRNPHYSMPYGLADIAVDGPAAEVFRISPTEPWRIIRTTWRVAGKVTGPIEGGGRAAGYFTSATGITIYRGDAFPPEDKGDAFIADVGSNLIHRKKLQPDGVSLLARRSLDETNREFIASKDLWFRPVQFANAPDGALYVADMYREVVEHPWSIPESIKKHLDLNSGNDKGRIYRIVPEGFKQPKPIMFSKATTVELVGFLAHSNGWRRTTASRLIYERQDPAAIGPLRMLFREATYPLARLHALYALHGLGKLDWEITHRALGDSDERVREHAIRLSEQFTRAIEALLAMTEDTSIRVRYQLAFSLGEFKNPGVPGALAKILRKDMGDSWVRAAVMSSLTHGGLQLLKQLVSDGELGEPGQTFLRDLLVMLGGRKDPAETRQIVEFIANIQERPARLLLMSAFAQGLDRKGISETVPDFDAYLQEAQKLASDPKASTEHRKTGIRLLGFGGANEVSKTLLALLKPENEQDIQVAALHSLSRLNDAAWPQELTRMWNTFSPRVRSEASSVLLAKTERLRPLMNGIEAGTISPYEIPSTQWKRLRNHSDPQIRAAANKVLKPPTTQRQKVFDEYKPALDLPGNVAAGNKIYLERCSGCHRHGSTGYALGPDLLTMKSMGKEKLLANIIEPNREVQPNFITYQIETSSDESLVGIVVQENANSLTLREAFGKESTVPRARIKTLQTQAQSLMPEGLETGLGVQQMADLLEFIATAENN